MAKKSVFKCKSCDFETTGPTKLGEHYKQHPSHRPETHKSKKRGARQSKPKKEQESVSPRFCPHCGFDMGKLEIAMDLVLKNK